MNNKLFIGLAFSLLSSSVLANGDLNTTPIEYKAIDTNYVLTGLGATLPVEMSKGWNWPKAPGTEVSINYTFNSDLNIHEFSEDEMAAIRSIMKSIDDVTLAEVNEIAADEISGERINITFTPSDGPTASPSLITYSCPEADSPIEDCQYVGFTIFINVDDLAMLDSTREDDEDSWIIDYKHDMANALSTITKEVLVGFGLQKTSIVTTDALTSEHNNQYFTAMSAISGSTSSEVYAPTKPKLLDVVYLQYMYGANPTNESGDTVYSFDEIEEHQTIYDTSGTDTLDASQATRASIIDLRPSSFSSIASNPTGFYDANAGGEHTNRSYNNLTILPNTYLEVAKGGSGNDSITGNAMDNTLHGNGGDDTFNGGSGNDKIDGGEGTDTVTYALNMADYQASYLDDGTYLVTASSGDEGSDSLYDVEQIQYADQLFQVPPPPNRRPEVSLSASAVVREGMEMMLEATVSDPDNDPLTFDWKIISGSGLMFENSTVNPVKVMADTVSKDESVTIELNVADPLISTPERMSVLVKNNQVPELQSLQDRTVNENTTFTIEVSATDADGDSLQYSASQSSGVGSVVSTSSNVITVTVPKVDSAQQIAINVTASDYMDSTSQTINISINNNVDDSNTGGTITSVDNDGGGGGGGSTTHGLLMLLLSGLLLRKLKY